ncbi:MAG: hypothetical protein VX891_01435, partial [Candidatus Thermoplasmatota archaeon]|nr:hypothetical protein [Candidatus Thermoplasmatota archaeon]
TAHGTGRDVKRGRHVEATLLLLKSLPSTKKQIFQLENQFVNWSSSPCFVGILPRQITGPP